MSGTGDFDFLSGYWEIANRRLMQPLAGSDDWDEFPSTSQCRSVFGGAANFDEISVPERGFSGLTLRLFHPGREEWSLYWASSRDGHLQPPVIGRFASGTGTFYSRETCNGADITVRFTCRHHGALSPVGTSILTRRRKDLGNKLDHGIHQAMLTGLCRRSERECRWVPGLVLGSYRILAVSCM